MVVEKKQNNPKKKMPDIIDHVIRLHIQCVSVCDLMWSLYVHLPSSPPPPFAYL